MGLVEIKSCVGDEIRRLRKKHPEMQRDQQIAIALSQCGSAKAEEFSPEELNALYDEIAAEESTADSSAFAYLDLADDPQLIAVQDKLKALLPTDAEIEWQLPKTFHLTLAYCMDATDTQIRDAATQVQATPIFLQGVRFGLFENDDERALHIAFDVPDDLRGLQERTYEGFNRLGAPMSDYSQPANYHPHVTLAYLPPEVTLPELPPISIGILANKVVFGRDQYKPYVEITLPSAIKAGRVLSNLNADAIRAAVEALITVLQRAGVDLSGVDAQTATEESVMKGLSNEQLVTMLTQVDPGDRLIAFGGAVKAVDGVPGEVGGYLVEFGEAGVRDLQRERFVVDTDFALDWYGERPLLFHHGLDDGVGAAKIGTIRALKRDDKGLWMDAILDERNEYVEYVRKLIDMGVLGLSAGSLPHLVRVAGDGAIKRFPIVEGSLTHTPADPRTRVMSLKSFLEGAATASLEPTGQGAIEPATGVTPPEAAVVEPPPEVPAELTEEPPQETEKRNVDVTKLIALIESILGLTLTDEQKAKLNEGLAPDMEAMQTMSPADMNKAVEAAVGKAFQLMQTQQATEDAFSAAIKARVGNGQPQSRVSGVTQQGRITDVKDLRYHHLKAQDLVFGAHILRAAQKTGLSEYGASETFLKAAADKALRAVEYENGGGYGESSLALKAAIKADEMVASNLSSNGQSWVGVAYETRLWEAVREAPIYKTLIDMGIMEVVLPQGFNSIYIPTEGTDPTFYSLAEQNDETSDERLPITGKSSNLTATRRQLTPGFIGARVSFSDIMEEDSLIPMLPYLRQKMELRGQEVIEYLMINGDTETGSTNINYDGSAVSALVDAKGRGPVYTALDGFLKQAIVTTSTLSRDGGAFSDDDYLATLKLLPAAQQVALERMAFLADSSTYLATVGFAINKTGDTRPGAATVESGKVTGMYGVKLLRAGQMGLADTDGKITYNAAGTKGRLLLVRPDQWALGRKRDMRTEVARDIDAQATVVVTTMRFGVQSRAASGGVAVSYNLTV